MLIENIGFPNLVDYVNNTVQRNAHIDASVAKRDGMLDWLSRVDLVMSFLSQGRGHGGIELIAEGVVSDEEVSHALLKPITKYAVARSKVLENPESGAFPSTDLFPDALAYAIFSGIIAKKQYGKWRLYEGAEKFIEENHNPRFPVVRAHLFNPRYDISQLGSLGCDCYESH